MLSLSTILCGQINTHVTIRFNIDDFTLEKKESGIHIFPKKYPYIYKEDIRQPALPFISVELPIEMDNDFYTFSHEEHEIQIMSDVVIEKNPQVVSTSANGDLIRFSEQDKEIPLKDVEYSGTSIKQGTKYIYFVVCPFRYDLTTKNLYLKNVINLNISLDHTMEPVTPSMRNTTNNVSMSEPFKYVIVTSESLKSAFEKLATWKTQKGVRTKILTTEYINSNYSGDSLQSKIKNALYDYYLNGMEYALLGGDIDVIPARICKSPFTTEDTRDMPVDLYFSCFDNNFEWDANGNHIYGESDDNIDLAPDIILTRVSISNNSEVDAFVDRIINYERNPDTDNWMDNILMCGAQIANYDNYYNGILPMPTCSDAQIKSEEMYNNIIHPLWPQGTRFRLFDTDTDHPDGANYEYNTDHLHAELEKGYTFVDVMNHSRTDSWGWLENWWKYKNTKAMTLNNYGNTIITTFSCYSNAFDKPEVCMSEAFIRNPNSGILAYAGLSREGWFPTLYIINNQLYSYMLGSEEKQFGRAVYDAKNTIVGLLSMNNHLKGMYMALNPMGDPEMPIFTSLPLRFENTIMTFSNGTLSVSTGTDSCRICVSSICDNGNSYYSVETECSTHTFSNIATDCMVCITKPGYIPYIARVGNPVFLQNETIPYDLNVIAGTTYIGRDVTNEKPEGAVKIESGKTTIKYINDVIIKNDFEVNNGASMEIIPAY